ncbi:YrzI family small protein [Anaerobacillus alkaliphilus]|uniref:YrzI family small protein n=1 Tax=Anaerobacillus alkaliphilus TaxID=1548597 RepID=A0A4Q0VQ25_9BACI|nr:YrzI family small protein [Anaerobacillus alkaliphilus]RXI98368.1 YrzI family small protein [Anaerobacillus alkaliphilus]
MVFNIFFLTITITKRQLSRVDLERALKAQINEQLVEENRQRSITLQRII